MCSNNGCVVAAERKWKRESNEESLVMWESYWKANGSVINNVIFV